MVDVDDNTDDEDGTNAITMTYQMMMMASGLLYLAPGTWYPLVQQSSVESASESDTCTLPLPQLPLPPLLRVHI